MSDVKADMRPCQWCGVVHAVPMCPRVKRIVYDNKVLAPRIQEVEFFPPVPVLLAPIAGEDTEGDVSDR